MIVVGDGSKVQCGEALEGPSGSLASPGFPQSFSDEFDCSWIIHVAAGGTIQLRVMQSYETKVQVITVICFGICGGDCSSLFTLSPSSAHSVPPSILNVYQILYTLCRYLVE